MRMIDAATCIGVQPEDDRPLDEGVLLGMLDQAGVDEALCTHSQSIRYDMRAGHAALLELCRRQPRLHPLASIHPGAYLGVREEITRCVEEGFVGFRFFPARQGWSLESETFLAAAHAVAASGLPLAVELAVSGDATRLARGTAGLGVPVILANTSYAILGEAIAVLERYPTCCLEASRLVTPDIVEILVSMLGTERLLFASNAPAWELAPTLRMIQAARISEEARAALLGGNARRIYHLERKGGQP